MKYLPIIFYLVLIHKESLDVDLVLSCTKNKNSLEVDYGLGWSTTYPADDYYCLELKEPVGE